MTHDLQVDPVRHAGEDDVQDAWSEELGNVDDDGPCQRGALAAVTR